MKASKGFKSQTVKIERNQVDKSKSLRKKKRCLEIDIDLFI